MSLCKTAYELLRELLPGALAVDQDSKCPEGCCTTCMCCGPSSCSTSRWECEWGWNCTQGTAVPPVSPGLPVSVHMQNDKALGICNSVVFSLCKNNGATLSIPHHARSTQAQPCPIPTLTLACRWLAPIGPLAVLSFMVVVLF
eukprot:CAMPEP_0174349308 /NCGR_PEP_ID=MMETSP0811_2-20130205/6023_1 /TAXON_ID=73025 ORGANISM="Eutreptiella gymnastica-like, Strain CCMP1594" /NCGR_SAMPLE_ID=MMETSP0811_2 /ASSEMBLY_ACC=CAM_ASM_000667 /LENGTH=142 /DNA_ID=CAMNT_0015476605 /DNA_START=706 /DNA_END=1134 /DNA_ORIENTATION=+